MKEKLVWHLYSVYNWFRIRFNYVMRKIKLGITLPSMVRYKHLMDKEQTQEMIKRVIEEGAPALVARFGSNEASCTAEGIGIQLGARKKFSKKVLRQMHTNAGLFPYGEEASMRFCEISCEAAKKVDLLGFWTSSMQDYLVRKLCSKDMKLTGLGHLEPYTSTNPWTAALKGKKVLVVHPFKNTIESQYQRRETLFEDPNVLPEFELRVVRAVQTIAGETDSRFARWEDALNYMHQETMKEDFDVAIIGCGAYGMPLAAKIKESGKIAIHLGGATQLLFGIRGARWDKHEQAALFNENWVRPAENETPEFAGKVEGACYW